MGDYDERRNPRHDLQQDIDGIYVVTHDGLMMRMGGTAQVNIRTVLVVT